MEEKFFLKNEYPQQLGKGQFHFSLFLASPVMLFRKLYHFFFLGSISISIAFIFLLVSNRAFCQFHISGIISDSKSGERLIGANIIEVGTTNGTATDNNGYFSLIIRKDLVQVSFIGYEPCFLHVSSDTLFFTALNAGQFLNEVVIRGGSSKRFNMLTLSQQEMLSITALGGKPDVLKAMQMLPGIQSQQEGSSLLSVRGGSPGENLYLIDNVPLIYVNHLGGFASVFNPDMINNIEIYKGGFPAKYGGKISSVVAITQREGDRSKLKGSLGIGVTDVSFDIEGPLLKDKASFIITGRKTLIDYLMLAGSSLLDGNEFYAMYGFYDINGKFSWKLKDKNHIYLNFYRGDDYLKFWNKKTKKDNEEFLMKNIWGNWMVSGRWNTIVSPRFFIDNTLSYNHYRLDVYESYSSGMKNDTVKFLSDYYSSVNDFSLRSDCQYKLGKNWDVGFGAKATILTYVPNKVFLSSSEKNNQYEVIRSNEFSFYQNNLISFSNMANGDIGIRLVNYHTEEYNYWGIEPRILFNVKVAGSHTLNFTFQRVNQFGHLVVSSGSLFNNEVWIPAGKDIPPSYSFQYSLGWKAFCFNRNVEAELNFYNKQMSNLIAYKEGHESILGNGNWRSKIEKEGRGKSFGAELLIRKKEGRWTGLLGYTYAHTTRQYPNINGGEECLYDYDRPHSVSVSISRKINEKWSFNLAWVYQTGLPYTPVVGRHLTPVIDDNGEIIYQEALIYGERNSARMKDYHRLDVGFTLETTTTWGRRAVWDFSVYNAYNRHNPAVYYYGYNVDGLEGYSPENYSTLKQFQVSYFPIIPTVSYKVFFEADVGRKEAKRRKGIVQWLTDFLNYKYD